MNYNKAIVAGRVVADPSIRKTQSGQSVTSFGIATNRNWTDKAGQKQEQTEFHNVVAWGALAEIASSYLAKGSLVLIEGRLETRSWERDGVAHRATEIMASAIQFGPRPGPKADSAKVKNEAPAPTPPLDGNEEDTGREMLPIFPSDDDEREEPPF